MAYLRNQTMIFINNIASDCNPWVSLNLRKISNFHRICRLGGFLPVFGNCHLLRGIKKGRSSCRFSRPDRYKFTPLPR